MIGVTRASLEYIYIERERESVFSSTENGPGNIENDPVTKDNIICIRGRRFKISMNDFLYIFKS
jgi:hypothetical protein